ncbi:hypothetical protein Rhopal_006647-T1 [Rhodotorula paludigena]|uniref:Protein kinase domain-containing protein n=1 Tax=Rhodotorula paludigena TaxID=86838 RepID=A0AAV5GLV4_9BASI|nr:hypothetical protein Rhopal_006647-T1 [Rhodotorula paludigena]
MQIIAMDAYLSTTLRQPLSFVTPAPSFSQSRLDKGRPVSMTVATTAALGDVPPSVKSATATFVHGSTPRSCAADLRLGAPATPSSPCSAASYGLTAAAPSSLDDEMADAFATPPPTTRIGTAVATSSVRGTLNPLILDSSPSNGRLPSKKAKTKANDAMPLTPPLTPPYEQHPSLLPAAELPTSPSPPPRPITVSGRALQHHRLHPLFASTYTLCEELGSGGFGFVVRAERNVDSLSVAVKFIERAKIPSHAWVKSRSWGDTPGLTQPTGPKLIPMEAFVLRSIRHDGVVRFMDLFEDERYFYLVMEHHGSPWQIPDKHAPAEVDSVSPSPVSVAMSPTISSTWPRIAPGQQQTLTPTSSPTMSASTLPSPSSPTPKLLSPPRPAPMERRSSCDLFECIEAYSRFDEATAKYVFAQIVEIVYALGQMGICHRDIKDENLAIDAKFRVKLIDFGSAVIFDPRQPSPFYQRFHGTQSFAAAEILCGEPYQAPPSEVWSLGVLLSILCTGECPFADAEAAKVGRLSRPKVRVSPEIDHLMRACLEVDVAKRITVSQIRRHPWLSSFFSR